MRYKEVQGGAGTESAADTRKTRTGLNTALSLQQKGNHMTNNEFTPGGRKGNKQEVGRPKQTGLTK